MFTADTQHGAARVLAAADQSGVRRAADLLLALHPGSAGGTQGFHYFAEERPVLRSDYSDRRREAC